MKTTSRTLFAALVGTSLGIVAIPAVAEPGDQADDQQVAHFDGDRGGGHFMRGGPHGPGRDGRPRMSRHEGRHGGPGFGPRSGGPRMGGPGMAMIVEQFDVNRDGTITREEIAAVTAERVKTFDADGDGALSLDEYKALWTDVMSRRIVRAFQRHDPDGDAKVTLDEYTATFDRLFVRFDRDRDGSIAVDAFGPPRGGHRPDGPPPGMGPGGPDGEPGNDG